MRSFPHVPDESRSHAPVQRAHRASVRCTIAGMLYAALYRARKARQREFFSQPPAPDPGTPPPLYQDAANSGTHASARSQFSARTASFRHDLHPFRRESRP